MIYIKCTERRDRRDPVGGGVETAVGRSVYSCSHSPNVREECAECHGTGLVLCCPWLSAIGPDQLAKHIQVISIECR